MNNNLGGVGSMLHGNTITEMYCEGHSGKLLTGSVVLTELPEPPIPVSEIGPIPPPPMFSTPSPTMLSGRAINEENFQSYDDYNSK